MEVTNLMRRGVTSGDKITFFLLFPSIGIGIGIEGFLTISVFYYLGCFPFRFWLDADGMGRDDRWIAC